ncbi:MAG: hypothetical protein AAF569_00080 [Pseudomonadota bacterium]
MRLLLCLVLLVFAATPAYAEDFVVKADSVAAVNETMERVKQRSEEDQQRFVTVSMMIMQDIIKKQQAKGQMDQAEMDAEIKKIMHNKTLTELEEYVAFYITE